MIAYFEDKWKPGMTENASIKIGLEALAETLEDGLSGDSVEICVIDGNGYRELSSEDTEKHLAKL